MSDEEQALVRSVFATPFDDLPRLKYSDWLEERGEVERSEFIRLQIEMTNCDPGCGPGRVCREIGEFDCFDLRKREHELLNYFAAEDMAQRFGLRPHETLYTVDSGYTVPGAGVELLFSRGFVSRVECTLREFMGGVCTICGGNGYYDQDDIREIERGRYTESCQFCNCTGRTPGLVDTLWKVQPVTEVVLTDREPWNATGLAGIQLGGREVWRWLLKRPGSEGGRDQLPLAIYELMISMAARESLSFLEFPTREAAIAALSRACVALGRKRAGLPTLLEVTS